MDTKWKNIRNVLSFIIFFLGVSLTLGNLSGLIRRMPGKISDWISGKLLEDDYQRSSDFRQHISGRLENFLSIAISGCPAYWGYYDNYNTYYTELENYWNNIAVAGDLQVTQYAGSTYSYDWDYREAWKDWYYNEYGELVPVPLPAELEEESDKRLTEEEKEKLKKEQEERIARQNQRMTEMYFEAIADDKNLLYSIYYDGKLLYSNTDLLGVSGSVQVPEGYNFLLYFDGEKVRITKDGKEEDIYGDGYYRWEDNDWYVPGYRNFPVNDKMKKAVIYMAAAREPVLYTVGIDKSGGYGQPRNTLYYMQYNLMSDRKLLSRNLAGLITGLVLLVLSCFCRKGRREITGKLAAFQGRIWVECKVFLVAVVLLGCLKEYFVNGSGGALWRDVSYAYAEGGLTAVGEYGYADWMLSELRYVSAWFWVILFWTVYLTVNDLKHNRRVWRQGLIAKCCCTFSEKELKQPLARRMVRRNGVLMGISAVCGILMLVVATGFVASFVDYAVAWVDFDDFNLWGIYLSCLLLFFCPLISIYLVGKKNVKAAREVDALAERIGEICRGDYSVKGGTGSFGADPAEMKNVSENGSGGRDIRGDAATEDASAGGLETAKAQLENIRQGMSDAVDEQMKSERMKVELIANVSHDLKTPLTSIISYVQFLKEEEGLPEHVRDYVKILDEKSQRLKNMVQDVFAVSKAASGELPMHMEELDFGKLLRQTLADMDEEIRDSRVSFRTELPEQPVMIMADGQRMYRVFQNLFQNALKYSLDGSRVYVTLKVDGTMAVASVKNTSHMELDEDKNFTERFYRGDKSRTDGGSGLGLSIAQSFTEACGGRFELEFNADLFIVRVSFQTDCV